MQTQTNSPIIVAEITKSWANGLSGVPELISQSFERVINHNNERGYDLKEWKINQFVSDVTLTETIIAIFQKREASASTPERVEINKKPVSVEKKVEWGYFFDDSFYMMWAVRPKGDKDFNSPRLFHVESEFRAAALVELLNEAHCAVPGK